MDGISSGLWQFDEDTVEGIMYGPNFSVVAIRDETGIWHWLRSIGGENIAEVRGGDGGSTSVSVGVNNGPTIPVRVGVNDYVAGVGSNGKPRFGVNDDEVANSGGVRVNDGVAVVGVSDGQNINAEQVRMNQRAMNHNLANVQMNNSRRIHQNPTQFRQHRPPMPDSGRFGVGSKK